MQGPRVRLARDRAGWTAPPSPCIRVVACIVAKDGVHHCRHILHNRGREGAGGGDGAGGQVQARLRPGKCAEKEVRRA